MKIDKVFLRSLFITFVMLITMLLGGMPTLNGQTTINTYTIWGTQGTTQDFVLTNANDLTVNDTLVIYGNLELKNDADITISPGGVLIIVGDFDAKNKVDLAVGGVLVVTGNFSKTGAQGEITNDGGDIYLFDDDPEWGNNNPPIVDYGDEDDIINDPIFDIIKDIISSGCSLALTLDSIVDVSTAGGSDGAIYITVTGAVDRYSWATTDGSGLDANVEDQTGLSAGTYNLAVTGSNGGATCSVFGSYVVSEASCTEPSITGTAEGTVCGTGTVALGATASAGTINWYDAETGGTPLGTGESFTTASISATTTYYVDATDEGCTSATRTSVVATVHQLPTATISATAVSICDGEFPVISIDFTTSASYWDLSIDDSVNPVENFNGVTNDPFEYIPQIIPVWVDDGSPDTYYIYSIQITDSNGCSSTYNSPTITVYKIPETGPQNHIPNTYAE